MKIKAQGSKLKMHWQNSYIDEPNHTKKGQMYTVDQYSKKLNLNTNQQLYFSLLLYYVLVELFKSGIPRAVTLAT